MVTAMAWPWCSMQIVWPTPAPPSVWNMYLGSADPVVGRNATTSPALYSSSLARCVSAKFLLPTVHMALQVDPFVFDCPPRRGSSWPPLKMTAKRYRRTGKSPPRDGLTLMFFHCIGGREQLLHVRQDSKLLSDL